MLRLVRPDEVAEYESAGLLIDRLTHTSSSDTSFVFLAHEGALLQRVIGSRSYAPAHLRAIEQEVVRLEALEQHAPEGLTERGQWVWANERLADYVRDASYTGPPNPQIPSVLFLLREAVFEHMRSGGKSLRLTFLKAVVVAFMSVPRPEPPRLTG